MAYRRSGRRNAGAPLGKLLVCPQKYSDFPLVSQEVNKPQTCGWTNSMIRFPSSYTSQCSFNFWFHSVVPKKKVFFPPSTWPTPRKPTPRRAICSTRLVRGAGLWSVAPAQRRRLGGLRRGRARGVGVAAGAVPTGPSGWAARALFRRFWLGREMSWSQNRWQV